MLFSIDGICTGPSANLDLRRLIIERQAAPDILLSGLITYDDVGKLFDLFVLTFLFALISNLILRRYFFRYYRWINVRTLGPGERSYAYILAIAYDPCLG